MRGLKNSSFGKFLKGAANKGIAAFVSGQRMLLMAGVKSDLKKLGEKYTTMVIDLEKKLISCDAGKWRAPQEFVNEENLGMAVGSMLNMGIDMWKDQFNRKKVTVKFQRENMIETTVQFDDGPVYGFHQVFDQHKNDKVDEKAKQLAQIVSKSDYSKEIVLKK